MSTVTLRSLRTSLLLHPKSACDFLNQQFLLPTSLLQQQQRPASTSTASPKTATATTSQPLSQVNGPASTLPAPLSLPVRKPNESFFPGYAFRLGKSYASFYKTGVFNIYKNFQASRPLQRALTDKHNSSLSAAISSGAFSRSDFQLLNRNWHDIKRVPAFALVFMICGEFTPLVVIAISNIVPWTCRIPRQIESDRKKLEERRRGSFRNLTIPPPSKGGVEGLGREQLMHISTSLGLSSRVWDWFDVLLTNGLLRRKVGRRAEYLGMDDRLIRDGGGVKGLVEEEVRMACVERGIDVLGRSEVDLRRELGAWMRSAEMVPVEKLLLTRPSVWPMQPVKSKKEE